jgi:hypothetical protein
MTADLSGLVSSRAGGVFRCIRAGDAPQAHPGYRTLRVELHGARDKAAFLKALGSALRFPDYFGANWDAFYDCLLDLDFGEVGGLLLVLAGASGFARAEPEEFAAGVDALRDAAAWWAEQERALLVVIELDTALLAPELAEISVRRG